MNKKYDIIVFGASGFTGQLICDYLSSHKNTKNMNWAIAGRNQKKLDIIKSKNDLMKNIDVLKVDSFDHDSVDNMCSQSKLILTTVGPYSIYGEYLIESCIKHSTHYIDLTGEPDFVNKIKSASLPSSIEPKSLEKPMASDPIIVAQRKASISDIPPD